MARFFAMVQRAIEERTFEDIGVVLAVGGFWLAVAIYCIVVAMRESKPGS